MTSHPTPEDVLPEQRLMQAILISAISDAAGQAADNYTFKRPGQAGQLQHEARAWIESDPDFDMVCELAGWSPIFVRRHALAFIDSGRRKPKLARNGGPHSKPRRQPRQDKAA